MLRLLILLFFLYGLVALPEDHAHAHEPPHFKYSREANLREAVSLKVHLSKRNLRTDPPQVLWFEVSSAVLLISGVPLFLLIFLPDLNKRQGLLKVLLAFAAGGLLGDAFLHLIPHAINTGDKEHQVEHVHHKEQHDHKHHTMVGLSVVAGIFVFLVVEKLVRLARHGQFDHTHATEPSSVSNSTTTTITDTKNKKHKKSGVSGDDVSKRRDKKANGSKQKYGIRASAYLNLAADFVHNFVDGLAIGASFLISRNVGMVTTFTVLVHELPHEIGDYVILIRSGCSARKAMLLQLITAIGAMLGASLSLLVAGVGINDLSSRLESTLLTEDLVTGCVLPFTAGGFIYIAMTSVLPDLLNSEVAESKPTLGTFRRIAQSAAEVLALITGVAMMAALSAAE